MLYQLDPAQFDKIAPLFRALDIHLATRALFAGTTRAQVWVDDPLNPRMALAQLGHRLFLTGTPRAEFAKTWSDWRAQHRAHAPFVVYYAPDAWTEFFDKATRRAREYYRWANSREATLPPGFTLRWVDAALLENSSLENVAALKEEMCSERASVDDFLARSFGVVALDNHALAGWCLSEYNTDHACEIGIATMEPYQRRGIATAMTTAFIAHAHARGITEIGWHCYASNRASSATACRAGFERVHEYFCLTLMGDQ